MNLHFESWVYLLGAASAIVPLILHLSHVQHKKHMRFSTTRFFTEAIRRAQRRLRIKQWLLLLIRMAVCFFLAVALAGPFFRTRGASALGSSRDVVVMIDDSFSMGYREGRRTRFERARQGAADLVRSLDPVDRVGVVYTSDLNAKPSKGLSADRDRAIKNIEDAKATSLAADVRRAFEQALGMFNVSDTTSKELHFFTDRQRSAWSRLSVVAADLPVRVFVVNCAGGPVENLSIIDLQVEGGSPMAGVPAVLKVHVRNNGKQEQTGQVTLVEELDGGKRETIGGPAAVNVRGAFTQVVRFQCTFPRGGRHRIRAELGPDNLAVDNRFYKHVTVIDKVPVLVVDGDPSDVAHLAETFFLQKALLAFRGEQAAIQPTVARVEQIANRNFNTFRLVAWANVPSAEVRVVARLEDYVESGGALLVFLGDAVDRNWWNTYMAGAHRRRGGLMPGPLTRIEGDPHTRLQSRSIAWFDAAHPALARFRDPTVANLGHPKFYAACGMNTGKGSVLMRLKDGLPLLVERRYGRGRVMVFTSSCDLAWSNLPVRALYVPLVHQLVSFLTHQQVFEPSYAIGEPARLAGDTWDRRKPIAVVAPDRKRYAIQASPEAAADAPPPVFDKTLTPGFYSVVVPQQEGDPARDQFAVNPSTAESDMTPIEEREIRDLLGRQRRLDLTLVEAPEALQDAIQKSSAEFRFWEVLMLIVLVMALIEPFLANVLTALGGPRAARQSGASAGTPAARAEASEPTPASAAS